MDFLKMHGAGNDFVLVDGRDGRAADWPALATAMCDRHIGVGADGLLLVRPSEMADVRMHMWNPDGSEAEMCGNGIRCFAKYLFDHGFGGSTLAVETGAGVLTVRGRGSNAWLQVAMGVPLVEDMELALPDLGFAVTRVSMGNPHAVRFVDDVHAVDLAVLGPQVEHHRLFPGRINFHICQVVGRGELAVRTWERGAGLTLACGTGACATAVAARVHGCVDEVVRMHVPGGDLEVSWDGAGDVLMTGPAQLVFEGDWPD